MLNKLSVILLVSIITFHIFIFTKLIYFPYPELFVYPYLTNHGLKPYSQILDQHFPGLMFFPINFDNLGMNDEIIARGWSIVVIILTHLLLYFISSKILKNSKRALLVNFLYLTWQPFFEGWVLWIDSFLPLILLPAFYTLYKNKLLLTGLLLGIGIVFKQTLIPLSFLVFLYILLQTKDSKSILKFLFGLLTPLALMILYLINIGVFKDFWYWTIVFNLTIYANFGTSIPTTTGFITRILLVYLSSLFGWFYEDKRLVHILFLFLLGSLIGVFDRADFVHYQPSLPFAVLATILGVQRLHKSRFFKAGIFIYIVIAAWWLNVFYKGHLSNKVILFDSQTKLLASKIKEYTKSDNKIFVFGAPPHLYQMADRLPVGNILVFQFPWFLKVTEDRILDGIKKDQPNIIISDRTFEIEGQKITEFARKIDTYIQQNYVPIDQVGSTTILRKAR